jgi:hypothetical protein
MLVRGAHSPESAQLARPGKLPVPGMELITAVDRNLAYPGIMLDKRSAIKKDFPALNGGKEVPGSAGAARFLFDTPARFAIVP